MSSLKRASKVSQAGELREERQLLPDIGQEEAEEGNAPASSSSSSCPPFLGRFGREARRVVERRTTVCQRTVSPMPVSHGRAQRPPRSLFLL
jgi:hypothetical protein